MRLSLAPKLSLVCVILLLAVNQSTPAQNAKNDWSSVQNLKPGSKLVVKTKTGQKTTRKLKTVTADSLTLSDTGVSGQEVSIRREDVAEIRMKSGGYTAAAAGLLGGLGAAGGFGIGYAIGESKSSRFRPEYPTMAVGAAVGVVVGVIVGNRGHVVYKAR